MMRLWCILICSMVFGATSLQAQFPGDHLDGVNRVRARFLSETLQEVSKMLGRYKDALEADDVDTAVDFFESEGFYATPMGESVQGKGEIKQYLRGLTAVSRGYRTSTVDFAASGAMAYVYGRFSRLITDEAGIENTERGTFVVLFYRAGRDWKIRSYVERMDGFR